MPEVFNVDFEIKRIENIGRAHGWSDIEIDHAIDNLEVDYGEECVVRLVNGREIRTPAHPEGCSYVRISQLGYELSYWSSDEWEQDPEVVMGAIFGCANGG